MPLKSAPERRRVHAFGAFRLDVAERRLSRDGSDIGLTRKTLDLLPALIELRAAALDPRNAQWAILHGDTPTTMRRHAQAEPAYERARDYPATLAEIQIRTGHAQAAVPLLRRQLDIPAGRMMSSALIEHDPRFESVRERLRGGNERP
ncbi:MAG TPA: hypothetical protein VGC55_08420 [Dokdonella sp.]